MLETNQTLGGGMKPIWIVVISAVVTAGVIGGGTYYLVNAKADKDKDTLQAQITTLNAKVADTEKSLADAQALATTQTTTATPTTATTPDPTASWKTFTGTNFTVKYPSTWITYNNELAGSEYWYESKAKQTANDPLVSIGGSSSTGDNGVKISADNEAQLLKAAIEKDNSNLSVEISTVKIGDNNFVKFTAKDKNTNQIDKLNSGYRAVIGNVFFAIGPRSISDSDLQNMLTSLKTK